jgi:hypothetical protein
MESKLVGDPSLAGLVIRNDGLLQESPTGKLIEIY